MDSRSVNKHIRLEAWPALREAGFTAFTTRSAWRYSPESIDVVNFQSFNSYLAGGLGCTTFSFGLNLGKYLSYVPSQFGPANGKLVAGRQRPAEYECHLRRALRKSLPQPEYPRPDIWFVNATGSNLSAVFADVRLALRAAISWFAAYEAPQEVHRLLTAEPEDLSSTWGFGAQPSPIRHYLLGFTAARLGVTSEAHEHLVQALASGCFTAAEPALRAALRRGEGAPSG
jgi:hypothetical protein